MRQPKYNIGTQMPSPTLAILSHHAYVPSWKGKMLVLKSPEIPKPLLKALLFSSFHPLITPQYCAHHCTSSCCLWQEPMPVRTHAGEYSSSSRLHGPYFFLGGEKRYSGPTRGSPLHGRRIGSTPVIRVTELKALPIPVFENRRHVCIERDNVGLLKHIR